MTPEQQRIASDATSAVLELTTDFPYPDHVTLLVRPVGESLLLTLRYRVEGHTWVVRDTLGPAIPKPAIVARCVEMYRILAKSYLAVSEREGWFDSDAPVRY